MITEILETATVAERGAFVEALQYRGDPADNAGLAAAYGALHPAARTYEQALGLALAEAREALGVLAPLVRLADSLGALEDQVREAAALLTTKTAAQAAPLRQRAASLFRALQEGPVARVRGVFGWERVLSWSVCCRRWF